jgi:hypothetical protein
MWPVKYKNTRANVLGKKPTNFLWAAEPKCAIEIHVAHFKKVVGHIALFVQQLRVS